MLITTLLPEFSRAEETPESEFKTDPESTVRPSTFEIQLVMNFLFSF